jgi:hypothetical protein
VIRTTESEPPNTRNLRVGIWALLHVMALRRPDETLAADYIIGDYLFVGNSCDRMSHYPRIYIKELRIST